jgi:ketosteroid isomerase-like protein
MKRLAIAVCVVVLVFTIGIIAQTPGQPKSGSAEQELIKLEKEWADAYMKRDLAFLDRIEAASVVMTDTEGNVFTKALDLEEVKSGVYTLKSWVNDEMKVDIYGDTAVVSGRNTSKSIWKGTEFSGSSRFTDTWVKIAGRWQCVASHSSKITQK